MTNVGDLECNVPMANAVKLVTQRNRYSLQYLFRNYYLFTGWIIFKINPQFFKCNSAFVSIHSVVRSKYLANKKLGPKSISLAIL